MPLDDRKDGRSNVRAWVRTYIGSGNAVYVAAYANHSDGKKTYMNKEINPLLSASDVLGNWIKITT